jgi:hypothetical protein
MEPLTEGDAAASDETAASLTTIMRRPSNSNNSTSREQKTTDDVEARQLRLQLESTFDSIPSCFFVDDELAAETSVSMKESADTVSQAESVNITVDEEEVRRIKTFDLETAMGMHLFDDDFAMMDDEFQVDSFQIEDDQGFLGLSNGDMDTRSALLLTPLEGRSEGDKNKFEDTPQEVSVDSVDGMIASYIASNEVNQLDAVKDILSTELEPPSNNQDQVSSPSIASEVSSEYDEEKKIDDNNIRSGVCVKESFKDAPALVEEKDIELLDNPLEDSMDVPPPLTSFDEPVVNSSSDECMTKPLSESFHQDSKCEISSSSSTGIPEKQITQTLAIVKSPDCSMDHGTQVDDANDCETIAGANVEYLANVVHDDSQMAEQVPDEQDKGDASLTEPLSEFFHQDDSKLDASSSSPVVTPKKEVIRMDTLVKSPDCSMDHEIQVDDANDCETIAGANVECSASGVSDDSQMAEQVTYEQDKGDASMTEPLSESFHQDDSKLDASSGSPTVTPKKQVIQMDAIVKSPDCSMDHEIQVDHANDCETIDGACVECSASGVPDGSQMADQVTDERDISDASMTEPLSESFLQDDSKLDASSSSPTGIPEKQVIQVDAIVKSPYHSMNHSIHSQVDHQVANDSETTDHDNAECSASCVPDDTRITEQVTDNRGKDVLNAASTLVSESIQKRLTQPWYRHRQAKSLVAGALLLAGGILWLILTTFQRSAVGSPSLMYQQVSTMSIHMHCKSG